LRKSTEKAKNFAKIFAKNFFTQQKLTYKKGKNYRENVNTGHFGENILRMRNFHSRLNLQI